MQAATLTLVSNIANAPPSNQRGTERWRAECTRPFYEGSAAPALWGRGLTAARRQAFLIDGGTRRAALAGLSIPGRPYAVLSEAGDSIPRHLPDLAF